MQVITVGRSEENNVVVSDNKVSRVHLQLVKDDNDGYSVVDLGSTNGTFVNGRRIAGEARLNVGDELRIGSSVLPWQSYFGGATAMDGAAVIEQGTDSDGQGQKPNRKLVYIIIAVILLLIVCGVAIWALRSGGHSGEDSDVHRRDSLEIAAVKLENSYKTAQRNSAERAREAALAKEKAALAKAKADSLAKVAAVSNSENDKKKAEEARKDAEIANINAKDKAEEARQAADRAKQAEKEKENLEGELGQLKDKLDNIEKEKERLVQENKFYQLLSDLDDKQCEAVCKNLKIIFDRGKSRETLKVEFKNSSGKDRIIEEMEKAKKTIVNKSSESEPKDTTTVQPQGVPGVSNPNNSGSEKTE